MTADDTPDSTEIEPMVPIVPTERTRADGGRPVPESTPGRRRRRQEPPLDTSYASPYTRDVEEIEPFVEDLR